MATLLRCCNAGSYTVSCFGLSLGSMMQPAEPALEAASSAACGETSKLLPALPAAWRALIAHLLSPACVATPGLIACSAGLVLAHGLQPPEAAAAAAASSDALDGGAVSTAAFRARQRQLLGVLASVRCGHGAHMALAPPHICAVHIAMTTGGRPWAPRVLQPHDMCRRSSQQVCRMLKRCV